MGKKICVIGASGVVGLHVVQSALRKGYKVNATMRDPDNCRKTKWLRELGNAEGNLEFYGGDLDLPGSYFDAVKGCDGVFICALPEKPNYDTLSEPKLIQMLENGVKNILSDCLEVGVQTVVVTTSTACLGSQDGEKQPSELCLLSKNTMKTLVDRVALRFGDQHEGMRVVVFNPNMILGPMFHPEIQESLEVFKVILKGQQENLEKYLDTLSFIDVRDLAELELAALENKNARGRYFGVVASWHWRDIVETLQKHYPEYEGNQEVKVVKKNNGCLQVHTRNLDEIVVQAIHHLKSRGEI